MKISKFTLSIILISIILISCGLLWRINQNEKFSTYEMIVNDEKYILGVEIEKGYRIEKSEDPDSEFTIYKNDVAVNNFSFITVDNMLPIRDYGIETSIKIVDDYLSGTISLADAAFRYQLTNATAYVYLSSENKYPHWIVIDPIAKPEYIWISMYSSFAEVQDLISALSVK